MKQRHTTPDHVDASLTERRAYLKDKLENIGLWNINYAEEGRRFNVGKDVIHRDVQVILESIDVTDVESVKFELARGYKKLVREAWSGLNNKDLKEADRVKWGMVLAKAMDSMTAFLEAYGVKKGSGLGLEVVAEILAEEGRYDVLKKLAVRIPSLRVPQETEEGVD